MLIGEPCRRDEAREHLDVPEDPLHPDPVGYRAERQALQQAYIARLTRENHLRHTANSDLELENLVLRLRDELAELRKAWERRQRRLRDVLVAILFGLIVLGGGGWWAFEKLSSGVA